MHMFYNIISRPQQRSISAQSTTQLLITFDSRVAASCPTRVRFK
jgi:hypothetical protein